VVKSSQITTSLSILSSRPQDDVARIETGDAYLEHFWSGNLAQRVVYRPLYSRQRRVEIRSERDSVHRGGISTLSSFTHARGRMSIGSTCIVESSRFVAEQVREPLHYRACIGSFPRRCIGLQWRRRDPLFQHCSHGVERTRGCGRETIVHCEAALPSVRLPAIRYRQSI
jgi:hypothetical protein